MPRGERPLDTGDSPLLRFAADLRRLRQRAGGPTYRDLAKRAHFSVATLSGAASGRRLPSLAVTLAYVRACEGDTEEWERRWQGLAAELAAEPVAAPEARANRPEITPGDDAYGAAEAARSPYAGLAAFQPEDAELFFGRERLVEELTSRLSRRRFVAVFGASGAGKSSLLRAGLLARWRQDAEHREVVLLTPGPHPVEECSIPFANLLGTTPGRLHAELSADRRALHRVVRQVLADRPEKAELMLVIDQFEEVFTLCRDAAERASFIDGLLTAAQAEGSRCRVVLGVRADFYAHCTAHPDLARALGDGQIAVGPLTTDELRRVITQPAVRTGCMVEGALLAELTASAVGQVGVLPLLSHALRETWRRRRGNTLTLAGPGGRWDRWSARPYRRVALHRPAIRAAAAGQGSPAAADRPRRGHRGHQAPDSAYGAARERPRHLGRAGAARPGETDHPRPGHR